MGIRDDLAKSVKFQQCRAWNVDGKFYHSLDKAIEALTDTIGSRIRLRAYYRRPNRLGHSDGFYLPGGFYERWIERLHRRLTWVVRAKYNKQLK